VQTIWPTARVALFGSSVTRLCEDKGDLDLTVLWEGEDAESVAAAALPASDVVEKLAPVLEKAGFAEVLPLPKARVPIVKFLSAKHGLRCDLGVNNLLAIHNSQLIAAYCELDPRVRPLLFLIKHWAKQRRINDPYRGTLSSYAYSLLLIHYLQNTSPPVLPCLQALGRTSPHEKQEVVKGFDTYFFKDFNAIAGFGSRNTATIAELLAGFFRLYADMFDYKSNVVSVRTGFYLDKRQCKWAASGKTDRTWLCIEDPFEVTHNLGRIVDRDALYEIRGEFMRASALMHENTNVGRVARRSAPDNLIELFEPFTGEWREDRGKKPPPNKEDAEAKENGADKQQQQQQPATSDDKQQQHQNGKKTTVTPTKPAALLMRPPQVILPSPPQHKQQQQQQQAAAK